MDIILGKTAGFCMGVKRAVEGALKEAEQSDKKIYCLGELVHNKDVIQNIESKGIIVISGIEEIQEEGSKVIIRAHGVDKKIYEKAKQKNLEIIDLTCPSVIKIHSIVEEYQENGYYIFLLGNRLHPEVIGTASYCGDNYSIIENEDEINSEIDKLLKMQMNNLLVIAQTTFSTQKFETMEKIIQEKIGSKMNLVIKNTICKTTEIRQKETDELSREVDMMIVIGGKNSSNTKKLYEIAQKNTDSLWVETAEELDCSKLKGYNKIGIMAGASTPIETINDVIRRLRL